MINQESRDYGAEVRYENRRSLCGRTNRLTRRVPARLAGHGQPAVPERGRTSTASSEKDQKDKAVGLALYGENALAADAAADRRAGVRSTTPSGRAHDVFLADGDQSDHRVFNAVLPKLGLLYALPTFGGQVYGNVSRSSEPPLLLELNSLSVPGFIDLRAQDAWQIELGVRGGARGIRWDVAAYDVELEDEILNMNVHPFPARRSPCRRTGTPPALGTTGSRAAWRSDSAPVGVARVAYTFARYRFVEDPTFEGNDIPGAPRHHLQAQVRLQHRSGLAVTPTLEWVPSSYAVNSENTARNDGWATVGLRAEYTIARAGVTAFAAGQNLTDTRYAASVQVDNATGRSFEPADARSFYVGFQWAR